MSWEKGFKASRGGRSVAGVAAALGKMREADSKQLERLAERTPVPAASTGVSSHADLAKEHMRAAEKAQDAGDSEAAAAHSNAESAHRVAGKAGAKRDAMGGEENRKDAEAKSEAAHAISATIETGSRGGTYYTTESGKKVYVKK